MLLLLCVFNGFSFTLTTDTFVYPLHNGSELSGFMEYYRTPQKNLPEDTVLHRFRNNEFQSWKADKFKQFYNDDQYWFCFVTRNTSSAIENLVLSVNGKGYSVVVYELDEQNNRLIKLDSSSVHVPLLQRPLPFRLLTFPVELSPSTDKVMFLKVQKTIVRNAIFKFHLSNQAAYLSSEMKAHLIMFLYIGFFLIALAFHVFLFLVFRETLHGWQTAYIFCSLIFVCYTFDFHTYLLKGSAFIFFSKIPTGLLPFTCVLAMIGVYTTLLKTYQYKIIHRFFIAAAVFCSFALLCIVCSYVLMFFLPEATFRRVDNLLRIPTFLNLLLYGPVFVISSVYLFFKVEDSLRIFLAAMFITFFFWFITFTDTAGKTDLVFIPPNNMVAAHVIEISVFLLLTIYKFWSERNERLQLLEAKVSLQKKLVDDVVEAQESERQRIAQELHDGVGGFLGALRMMVNRKKNASAAIGNSETSEVLKDVEQKLDSAIKDVREISHNLMPSDFESKQFTELMTDYVEYINDNGDVIFDYYFDEKVNNFEKPLLISFYRISLELIRNIQKHSQATKATIQLIVHHDHIQLQIEDNGKGFQENHSKGIGLASLKSRVQYHNGKMMIDSGKLGTTVIVEIPFKNGNDDADGFIFGTENAR